MFEDKDVNLTILKNRAFNYRWAEVADGVIPLTAADPDFPVSEKIVEAIKRYANEAYFSYGPPHGTTEFKEAIAAYFGRHYQASIEPNLILPVNSAAFGLYTVMKHVLLHGGNVIFPDPVDFLFRKSVEHAGGEVRTCALMPGTANFDTAQLVNLIDENTKAIMICNPNNPLGLQIDALHLNELVKIAIKHNLYIVSDEIWADIHFGQAACSLMSGVIEAYHKAIVVSGLSKNFGLAGLRIGYVICKDIAVYDALFIQSGHAGTAFGLQPVVQAAGTAALSVCDDWLEAFRSHLYSMRSLSIDAISQSQFLKVNPQNATYLLFPELVKEGISSEAYVAYMHQNAKVALVPGGINWFEKASEGKLRICFATSRAILTEAFERILKAEKLF